CVGPCQRRAGNPPLRRAVVRRMAGIFQDGRMTHQAGISLIEIAQTGHKATSLPSPIYDSRLEADLNAGVDNAGIRHMPLLAQRMRMAGALTRLSQGIKRLRLFDVESHLPAVFREQETAAAVGPTVGRPDKKVAPDGL